MYEELGADSGASDDDIRGAVDYAKKRLQLEIDALEREIKATLDQVPGLEAAYERLERQGLDAGGLLAAEARAEIAKLEGRAVARNARFLEQRELAEAARRRILELNALGIDNPEQRLGYDRAHPPLALLRPVSCTSDEFLSDPHITLFLVREELARFLAGRGETVFHPSDLTREDFTSDFTWCRLLDGESHE